MQETPPPTVSVAYWSLATRALFRFVCSYLVLYGLYTLTVMWAVSYSHISGHQYFFVSNLIFSDIVPWVGRHVLRIAAPVGQSLNADSLFEWVEQFVYIVLALISALVWSALDRKRTNYRVLHEWLNQFVRFVLAVAMFGYGLDKVFPLQFHSIARDTLVRQVGDLDHFNLLWTFMAASKGYTIFCGCLETLGGVLLLAPRLAALGALLSVAVMSNVFALNLAYNVSVKLFSFNLLLMAVFLAAPVFPHLIDLLIRKVPAVPVRAERLSNNPRINRGAPILYGVLGALVFIVSLLDCGPRYFAAQKKAAAIVPLQGIWLVDEFSASGGPQHSLFTKPIADELHIAPGEDRWTKLIFDGPNELVIQSINGALDYVVIKLDKSNTSAQLSDDGDKDWKGHLTLQQPQQGLLDLQGEVNGMVISARLHKMDESRFPLTNEGMQLIE